MTQPIFKPAYLSLPEGLYTALEPTAVPAPSLYVVNEPLASQFGFHSDWLAEHGADLFSGQKVFHDGPAAAMAYSGHQFGNYAPLLGDGRARLVGEAHDQNGLPHELHLKGAGRTPYSRGGDGKATLGSAIREYVVSEAMAALGVPTSRSLAIITTGEEIMRQAASPGAVLTRTARSHLRVGTFQYTMANHDIETLKALADFAIERLDPDLMEKGDARYADWLTRVADRQANLIARWMSFGFIHGVMNTDNMTISGETIDYGPCAFMDDFHPAKVFSSIDYYGRYAWNKQPEIGLWNLSRLAEAILPLLGDEEEAQIQAAEDALKDYPGTFKTAWTAAMTDKLGLPDGDHDAFINDSLTAFMEGKADFTRVFTALTRYCEGGDKGAVLAEFETKESGENWLEKWQTVTGGPAQISSDQKAKMRRANPVRIARNHRVEEAIFAAERGTKGAFLELLEAVKTPFEERSSLEAYEAAPQPEEIVHQTFCGT